MSEDDKRLVAKAIEIVQQELGVTTGRWISTADMLPAEGQMCVIAENISGHYCYCLGWYHDMAFGSAEWGQVHVDDVDWWCAVPERSEEERAWPRRSARDAE